jgi:hypothetical protein
MSTSGTSSGTSSASAATCARLGPGHVGLDVTNDAIGSGVHRCPEESSRVEVHSHPVGARSQHETAELRAGAIQANLAGFELACRRSPYRAREWYLGGP